MFSVTSQIWATKPNSVGRPSLPLRIGRASGSESDTNRSVIFNPRARRSICWGDLLAPASQLFELGGGAQLGSCARPRAALRAWAASPRASRAERAILAPARELSSITWSLAWPVRRESVREIAHTVRPTERDRSRTRAALPLTIAESLRPSLASARVPASASIASEG